MEIFKEIRPLKAFLSDLKKDSQSIGYVPTMGALHPGHLSLLKASQGENKITVCSVYVNPAQFNNPSDLAEYPRTLQKDVDLLQKAQCDVLFCPDNDEMYLSDSHLNFDFGPLDKTMEGRFRPGHFSGVALVVSKLFHIVSPDRAYFGQKDFQQFKIIEKLVEDLKFDLTLRCMPIEREPSGLAMSSRNARLSADELKTAPVLYQSLLLAKRRLEAGKKMNEIRTEIAKSCTKVAIRLEYLELAETANLTLRESVSDNTILLIAAYVGEVRLIDNLLVRA